MSGEFPYLQRRLQRSGKVFFYVRLKTGGNVRIGGEYGSPGFVKAYHAAMVGDPIPHTRKNLNVLSQDLIRSRVIISDKGCWEWTGKIDRHGYGHISLKRKDTLAHRASYLAFFGDLDQTMTLDHLCRNTRCVNPDHLEPVSMAENIMRGTSPSAQNARKTYCKNGHSLSGDNLYAPIGKKRTCRTCNRMAQRRRADRMRIKASGSGLSTTHEALKEGG